MRSKKETLIETLRGSLEPLRDLPTAIDDEEIYDETGHVDTEFLTAILEWVSEAAALSRDVHKALNHILGCDDVDTLKGKGRKDNTGAKWTVEEILRHCTLEENVLKLPDVPFNKKSYLEAKKWIEEAGGSWTGGKTQGFTFPFDASRVFGILHDGRRCNLAQEFQFFATPDFVADSLAARFSGITPYMRILEPSAGTGSLVRAVRRICPMAVVDCLELMPENRQRLVAEAGVRLIGEDFMQDSFIREHTGYYERIIANPPFSNNQDIRHVRQMYELLAPYGEMAVLTSAHWELSQEEICRGFRQWLDDVDATVAHIAEGAFKDSGTSIRTIMIYIIKRT